MTILFIVFVQLFVRRNGKVGLLSSLDCIKGFISVWSCVRKRSETNKTKSRSMCTQFYLRGCKKKGVGIKDTKPNCLTTFFTRQQHDQEEQELQQAENCNQLGHSMLLNAKLTCSERKKSP